MKNQQIMVTSECDGRGVLRTFHGLIHGHQYLNAVEVLQSTPDFDHLCYVINDFSQATVADDMPEHIELIGAITVAAVRTNPRLKFAYITHDDGFVSTIKNAVKILTNNTMDVRFFPTVDEARNWAQQR